MSNAQLSKKEIEHFTFVIRNILRNSRPDLFNIATFKAIEELDSFANVFVSIFAPEPLKVRKAVQFAIQFDFIKNGSKGELPKARKTKNEGWIIKHVKPNGEKLEMFYGFSMREFLLKFLNSSGIFDNGGEYIFDEIEKRGKRFM